MRSAIPSTSCSRRGQAHDLTCAEPLLDAKVWQQLRREGKEVARCTVAGLMRAMGLHGVVRGKPVRTTISDQAAACPLDRVNRKFWAPKPNALWVSDFTYVATWQVDSES